MASPSKSDELANPPSSDQKILLVCIINYKRLNITFDYLYNLFGKYGDVKKVKYINSFKISIRFFFLKKI